MSLPYILARGHWDACIYAHGSKEQLLGPHSLSILSKGNASLLPKTPEVQELLVLLQSILSELFYTIASVHLHLRIFSLEFPLTTLSSFVGCRIIEK